ADSTQLSRHLYLVRQLQEVGFNTLLILTMGDQLRSSGHQINVEKLQDHLGLPVLMIDPRKSNSKQAVLAFMGDVYEGLNAGQMTAQELAYISQHLRILSGLYGLLRPLDLIQPYRLEMGTSLPNAAGNNLYAFWGETITAAINAMQPKVVVNLASTEYFKSVKPKLLNCPLITPVFEDWKNGKYKIISFYAKRARGLMVRWAAEHNITQASDLKTFNAEDYAFDADASNGVSWVFRRQLAD
ncbi:MAG: peroxide stress protein YaaA, partial [Burkholderiales bacterium]|nr:peroxide stress protein YaaA [Burkholderiales bacterium]